MRTSLTKKDHEVNFSTWPWMPTDNLSPVERVRPPAMALDIARQWGEMDLARDMCAPPHDHSLNPNTQRY
ncbi:MAG: hypothetical protein AAGF56_15440, partial [Pseudomonadota bacterium]